MGKKERFVVKKIMDLETPKSILTDYDTHNWMDKTEIVIRITVESNELDKILEMWYNNGNR